MARDIIVHYDEEAQMLVCGTVDAALTAPLLRSALPHPTSVESLKTSEPDEAERRFGAGILALLDVSSVRKLGIRDYQALARTFEKSYQHELDRRLQTGDAAAQFEAALQVIGEALSARSKIRMDDAETLLRSAAAKGHDEAQSYLKDLWPPLKRRADKTFD